MSVLIFVEIADGAIKSSSLEAVAYGAKVAEMTATTATALVLGELDSAHLENLGNYGATKVLHVGDSRLNAGVIQAYQAAKIGRAHV